jgi:hypothetical protein
MDQFIENFLGYAGFGPGIAKKDVPATTFERYRGKLPDKLLEYWEQHGWCGFGNGLLWTVDPDEWKDELEAWIGDTPFMERDSFYVIARSAFGELILWGTKTGQSLKIVPAYGGIFPAFDDEKFQRRGADKALQLFFSSNTRANYDLKDADGQPLFDRAVSKLGRLGHDTLYGFVPALPLGGGLKLENLRKLDAHVYLDMLSQVAERQVMADVAAAVKG